MATFRYQHDDKIVETEFDWDPEAGLLWLGGTSYPCNSSSIVIGGRRVPFWIHKTKELVQVWLDGVIFEFPLDDPRQRRSGGSSSGPAGGTVSAKMPGKVLQVAVSVGDEVNVGQNVLVMESMKMELAFDAPVNGKVSRVEVAPGELVSQGQLMIEIVEHSG